MPSWTMEKKSYVEITRLAYNLRRDELNGFTLSGTYTDTLIYLSHRVHTWICRDSYT